MDAEARIADLEAKLAAAQGLIERQGKALQDVANVFTELDGSLVPNPGTPDSLVHVSDRIRATHETAKRLRSALFCIAETIMPIGSYSQIEATPMLVKAAVQDLFDKYLATLRLLPKGKV